jgi:CubicO group peptidase (beta-lactamase class C family)
MDRVVLDQMAERFAEAAEQGELFSGAQMAVYRNGRLVLDVGGGMARPRTGMPVTPDTLFVIFS